MLYQRAPTARRLLHRAIPSFVAEGQSGKNVQPSSVRPQWRSIQAVPESAINVTTVAPGQNFRAT